jgi:hypothetical protein
LVDKLVSQFHITIELFVASLSKANSNADHQIDITESGIINSHDNLFPLNALHHIVCNHVHNFNFVRFASLKAFPPTLITVSGIVNSNNHLLFCKNHCGITVTHVHIINSVTSLLWKV